MITRRLCVLDGRGCWGDQGRAEAEPSVAMLHEGESVPPKCSDSADDSGRGACFGCPPLPQARGHPAETFAQDFQEEFKVVAAQA